MRPPGAGFRRRDARPTLADGWYSWHLPGVRPLTDRLQRWPDVVRGAALRHYLATLAALVEDEPVQGAPGEAAGQ